ncbi:hypothetical protein [Pseudomonas sp. S11P7]|uniref:hypothetical protein n=1 Tax=Pseudomonas sp. S11P7 TaxID=3029169 RepID=UPI00215B83A8|nr:hypothetical protein [Pseudomonas sp. S11P7]MCR8973591.1 hypothetical protein [Pseudomonas sp. S11P7]
MNGGAGFDTASYEDVVNGVGVTLNLKTGSNTGIALGDSYSGIELYKGTNYTDTFVSGAAADAFEGLQGSDTWTIRPLPRPSTFFRPLLEPVPALAVMPRVTRSPMSKPSSARYSTIRSPSPVVDWCSTAVRATMFTFSTTMPTAPSLKPLAVVSTNSSPITST